MGKPLIFIPTPVQDEQRRSYCMGKGYIDSVMAAGGVPVMVPVTLVEHETRALFDQCAGVLLAGGGDIDPLIYQEPVHEATSNIDRARDQVEIAVARWAVDEDKPLFGICRGIQSLNVAFGGTLVQDIPSQWQNAIHHNGHYNGARRDEVLHTIELVPGSRAFHILGGSQVGVNSFHHQAVKDPAGGLVATARAPDGIIETLELPGKRFVVGVQWHPEEMTQSHQEMLNLFVAFIDAASKAGTQ